MWGLGVQVSPGLPFFVFLYLRLIKINKQLKIAFDFIFNEKVKGCVVDRTTSLSY